ncbi:MAG: 3-ketoacyl-ACP reductase, partial [Burkholderiaceae bacterium]
FDLLLVDAARNEAAELAIRDHLQPERRAIFLSADIADIERREPLGGALFEAYGAVDCLVNNAGVQVNVRGDLLDVTPARFDRVIGSNLRGTFFLTQAVARRMLQQTPAPGVHRSIVTISSANAYSAQSDRPEYCISKLSPSMMTRLFALRLGPAGICTYEVRPGIIRTRMTAPVADKCNRLIADGLTPIARWDEPQDVAGCVRTLATGQMSFSTGRRFTSTVGCISIRSDVSREGLACAAQNDRLLQTALCTDSNPSRRRPRTPLTSAETRWWRFITALVA